MGTYVLWCMCLCARVLFVPLSWGLVVSGAASSSPFGVAPARVCGEVTLRSGAPSAASPTRPGAAAGSCPRRPR
eukprot:3377220-Pyramimonas_sp.AAC.1